MSGFEMVFALFGLLLGLAVAELLTGFAQSWKARLRAETKGVEPVRGVEAHNTLSASDDALGFTAA